MNCTKCGQEIIGGFYNRPSGVHCVKCGERKDTRATTEKLNKNAAQMAKLIIEMDKYLQPKHAGQINTINTGSIFHVQMIEILKKLS